MRRWLPLMIAAVLTLTLIGWGAMQAFNTSLHSTEPTPLPTISTSLAPTPQPPPSATQEPMVAPIPPPSFVELPLEGGSYCSTWRELFSLPLLGRVWWVEATHTYLAADKLPVAMPVGRGTVACFGDDGLPPPNMEDPFF